jgi:hypothetical protein
MTAKPLAANAANIPDDLAHLERHEARPVGLSGFGGPMRMRNGLQNRALEPAKFGQPLAEQAPQQTGDFLGAPVFRFQPCLGLGCKINGRKFALHNDLR